MYDKNTLHFCKISVIRFYASTSIFILDLRVTTIFSSKIVTFSTSLLVTVSLYSIIAVCCSSRKSISSCIRICRSFLSATAVRISCSSSRRLIICVPRLSTVSSSLETLISSICKSARLLLISLIFSSRSSFITASMFCLRTRTTVFFCANPSLTAVTTAPWRISSSAGQ